MVELVDKYFESCKIRHISPRFRDRQHQRAMSKSELIVQDDEIAVGTAILLDDVHASDANIPAALTHTDTDIPGPYKQNAEFRQNRNLRLIFARVGLEDGKPRGSKKTH